MDLFNIFIQFIGVCGVICSLIAFQCKTHGKILFFRTMNEFLFGIQYIFLGAYTGAAMNFLGCARNIFFAQQVKKKQKTVISRIAFSIFFIIMVVFTWSGSKSLLIGIAKVASTFAYGCKNTVVMRIIILVTSTAWLIYNIQAGSLAGMLCEIFTLGSIIVALLRIAMGKLNNTHHNEELVQDEPVE